MCTWTRNAAVIWLAMYHAAWLWFRLISCNSTVQLLLVSEWWSTSTPWTKIKLCIGFITAVGAVQKTTKTPHLHICSDCELMHFLPQVSQLFFSFIFPLCLIIWHRRCFLYTTNWLRKTLHLFMANCGEAALAHVPNFSMSDWRSQHMIHILLIVITPLVRPCALWLGPLSSSPYTFFPQFPL